MLSSSLRATAMQAGWHSLLRRGGKILRLSASLVVPSARAGTTPVRARQMALSAAPALYFLFLIFSNSSILHFIPLIMINCCLANDVPLLKTLGEVKSNVTEGLAISN